MEDSPAQRLKNLRKAKGFKTPEEAAQRFGWSVHTYKSHEDGSRGITEKKAKVYADKFGSDPSYVMFGIAHNYQQSGKAGGLQEPQWLGKNIAVRKIPVWGIVDAQDGDRYALNTEDTPIDYIEPLPQQNMDKDAYAVLVAGDSMVPAAKPGYLACVNTRKPVLKGDICVIELKDDGGLIKEFVKRENGKIYLHQYNPPKDIQIDEKTVARILPVVGFIIRK